MMLQILTDGRIQIDRSIRQAFDDIDREVLHIKHDDLPATVWIGIAAHIHVAPVAQVFRVTEGDMHDIAGIIESVQGLKLLQAVTRVVWIDRRVVGRRVLRAIDSGFTGIQRTGLIELQQKLVWG